MSNKITSGVMLACLGMGVMASAQAQEKPVSLEIGADIVSSYLWRGQKDGGFSAQPSAKVNFAKPALSFEVWASASLFKESEKEVEVANMEEIDLTLSWEATDRLTLSLMDYYLYEGKYIAGWRSGEGSAHTLEAGVAYDFGPLSLAWNTVILGDDFHATGDRRFSTYVEAEAPFTLGGVDCSATLGFCPWDDGFTANAHNFSVVNLSLTATKEIKGFPLFSTLSFNPRSQEIAFCVGVSL